MIRSFNQSVAESVLNMCGLGAHVLTPLNSLNTQGGGKEMSEQIQNVFTNHCSGTEFCQSELEGTPRLVTLKHCRPPACRSSLIPQNHFLGASHIRSALL